MRYLGVAALALVLSIPAAARLTRTAPYGFPWLTMWSRGWPPVRAATSVAATLKMAVSGGTATRPRPNSRVTSRHLGKTP